MPTLFKSVEVQNKLSQNDFMPVKHPEVIRCAKKATSNQKTLLDKTYAVYLWTIEHTYRDPNVRGCGLGEAIKTLTEAPSRLAAKRKAQA